MSKFCTKCGNELKEGVGFCPQCGNAVGNTSVPTTQTTTTTNKAPEPNNGIAIAGFVCAILGVNLVGLILSIIGLNGAKKANGKNKGLALAGVIISGIRMVLSVIIIVFYIFAAIFAAAESTNSTSTTSSSSGYNSYYRYYDY